MILITRRRCAASLLVLVFAFGHASAQSRTSTVPIDRLVATGDAALREQRFGDALAAFTEASSRQPRDPSLRIAAGLAAAMLGRLADARTWAEGALALDPREPEAYLLLAQVYYREGEVAKALDTCRRGLKQVPGDKDLQAQLETWSREATTEERFHRSEGAHFSVLFEGPADDALARRAVEILERAYWDVGSALMTYPARPIQVVLYTRDQFRDITRGPAWGGGVYDGRIKIPMRGALDHATELERILKHEYVHAVVATLAGPTLPAWVDEGLATVFEPDGLTWSRQYLERTTERLPLASLSRGFGGLSSEKATLAYALSAVSVKRMMDLRGAPSVVDLLKAVGGGTPFESAFNQTIYVQLADFEAMMMRQ